LYLALVLQDRNEDIASNIIHCPAKFVCREWTPEHGLLAVKPLPHIYL
jgi:hypothetical protein